MGIVISSCWIIIPFLTIFHRLLDSFKGVIKHLSRDIFDIHYIYIMEKPVPPSVIMQDSRDKLTVVKKELDDSHGFNKWIEKPRKDIEALNLDILLYLDLTVRLIYLFYYCI
jgi:hypothetical protein